MNSSSELLQNWCSIHLLDNPCVDELKPCMCCCCSVAKAKKWEREYERA
jgi:hypothetical protein